MKLSLGIILSVVLGLASIGCSSSETAESFTVYGSSGEGAEANLSGPQALVRALGSPSALNFNVVSFWISPNADCSDRILVQDYGTSPETFDLVNNPVLFTGNPAAGTYECVIIEFEDTPTFTANAAAVAANPICGNTSTLHTLNLYRDGENDQVDLDGNVITGSGGMGTPITDVILAVATTDPAAASAAGWGENQVGELNAPLTIPGTTTFVFDFTDQIVTSSDNSVDYCWVEGPEIRFE